MDFINALKGTINSVSKDVASKVNTTTAIAKLNSRIKENEQTALQIKTELGTAVYEAWDQSADTPFAEILMKLKKLEEDNLNCQKEIARIQEEQAKLQEEKARQQEERAKLLEAKRREAAKTMENIILCPSCGARNDEEARFCANCGKQLEPAEKRPEYPAADIPQKVCPTCGAIIGEDELYCMQCGTKINDTPMEMDDTTSDIIKK